MHGKYTTYMIKNFLSTSMINSYIEGFLQPICLKLSKQKMHILDKLLLNMSSVTFREPSAKANQKCWEENPSPFLEIL